MTYTAQWQAIAYTIHFSATGASGATADQTYQFDGTTSNTLNRNGFSMSGKQFLGWSLTDGASTADYADGALINTTLQNAMANSNGSITLYAVGRTTAALAAAAPAAVAPAVAAELFPAASPSKPALATAASSPRAAMSP